MIYKIFCGTMTALMFGLGIYMLLASAEDVNWGRRLKACAGFGLFGLLFLGGLLRELKKSPLESAKKDTDLKGPGHE